MMHSYLTPFALAHHAALRRVLLAALALALGGCGGGGATTSPVPATSPISSSLDAADLQGRWVTAVGVSPGYTALVLPAQAGSAQTWVLAQDVSSLSRLTLVGGAMPGASGKTYSLTGAGPAQTVSVDAVASLSASPRTLTLSHLGANPVVLSLSDALTSAPMQTDAAGSWRASAGLDAIEVNWSVSAAGVVSGFSSTGCSWSGTVMAMSNAHLYSAHLLETCAGSVSEFAGVATVNVDKTRLTVVGTVTDESRALVLLFGR